MNSRTAAAITTAQHRKIINLRRELGHVLYLQVKRHLELPAGLLGLTRAEAAKLIAELLLTKSIFLGGD